MADPYSIRPVTDDELPSFRSVHGHAFHTGPGAVPEPVWRRRLFETDRSLAAFDPALPGGVLGAAGAPRWGGAGRGGAGRPAFCRSGGGEGAPAGGGPADPALSLRLAEPKAAATELAKVYDSVLPGQPGFFTRSADWWDRIL